MPGGACDCECARCDQGYHCNNTAKGCHWNGLRSYIAHLARTCRSWLS